MSNNASCDALYVNKQIVSYEQLHSMSLYVASLLPKASTQKTDHIAILSHREITAYAAIVACVMADKTYVPLNVKAPKERLVSMLLTAQINTLVVSVQYQHLAIEIKTHLPALELILIEESKLFLNASNHITPFETAEKLSNSIRYIMFTSGSTGKPKGVPISEGNLLAYLDFVVPYCELSSDDRASQTFDLTFDLSVHDLFVTWLSGACLYVLPESALFSPGAFIKKHQLTAWFSVPSTGAIMQKFGMLKAHAYPSLKLSLFCGEALPTSMALAWQKSAPNSKVVNFYGPTEATIACGYFEVPNDYNEQQVVPIGKAFEHMSFAMSSNEELLIAGEQVTSGYLEATVKMNENFRQELSEQGKNVTWYYSGDKVAQHEDGYFIYKGRLDEQVKIQGYRVELPEIEAIAKAFLKNNLVKALVWPKEISSFNKSIYLFVQASKNEDTEQAIIEHMKNQLPHYMQPKKIVWLTSMPLNLNGKIDRNALRAMLE
ncbi:AMP-binding protein [Litorilituus lipolyticus]|uniref:AMP-dependent synthetase/ligase domain-containing protein n=1 Tax=Litorilituus lipolyticus TaxID=2491017 RepID=A0A502L404_9GAMM|nr:AMP-binding protein [Litorilituus lipolyticus]TPH17145.1 hypothetical protein EPA86_05550 [Litorilituus lipolyticus]